MSRYKIRITDGPGQPWRTLNETGTDYTDLELAKRIVDRIVHDGQPGGRGAIYDVQADHGYVVLVHEVERTR
jgi:hypothetical protein